MNTDRLLNLLVQLPASANVMWREPAGVSVTQYDESDSSLTRFVLLCSAFWLFSYP